MNHAQILTVLREEVLMYRESYKHRIGPHKGKVMDVRALRTIAGLEAAIKIVRRAKARRAT